MNTLLVATSALSDVLVAVSTQLPNPDPVQPPGTEAINDVLGWAKWIALAVCILGLFAAGAMMSISSRRGEGGEHVGRIGWALGGVIVISAAVALVGFLAGS